MHRKNLWNLVLLGAVAWLPSITSAQNAPKPAVGPPEVTGAVYHDVSPRLGDMASIPGSTSEHREVELKLIPRGQTVHQKDPVVQTTASAFVATTSGLNIAGVGNGDYGFTPNAAPPDTNGAVGATQYVQWVNESFAVFDKTTGAIAPGFPKSGNTLWSGFGGGCQTNNDGDPVVAYDKAANRWILTQFSVSTTPYLQCVAVSTTSDATGSYFRYAFSQPNFNDYPKPGVWPDGYYFSFNMFNGNSFVGGRACAFDRTKMLTGAPATQVCFQLTSTYGGLLPSDLDGSAAPPAGSPNYFLSFGNDSASMDLWKFHVDFATPANSTFTHSNFAVPAFAAACGGGGTCIPQAGTTQLLDSLADRLMHRLAYRNFGSYESLVVNHSVTAASSVGVRWYEIRNPGGTPTVFQSSTYAPDSSYRWMGSIAMDKVGNIALGYSVSSSTLHPAVRYTGRAPGDPVGTLQAETSIIEGGGSQNGNNLSRWGDYSAMTIDPTDDCTFFYTNEYEKTTGSFNWSTRIASFKFPSCTTAQVLTSITVSPSSATVSVGRTKQFSATGLDQFGNPMTTQPTFTWAVNGGGTIDSSGLFSATTTGGPFTVTASSTGVNGMASVTVTTPLSVTGPTSLSSGTVGVAYGPVQFTASGGTGGNTWTSTGLPTGLTLSSTGSLSGTPGAGSQGSYNPQFTVQDSSNATASTTLSLTINAGVSGTISLISHASASAKGTATATSPAINTTGATLLVMMASDYSRDSTTDTHTDSKGNTWIPLTNCVIGLNNVTAWYTLNPITDPSHTFSVTGSYTSMAIEAYSGVTSFQSATCKISSGATLQAGPVTTTVPSLVLTFIDHAMPNPQATVSGGFTIIDYQAYQGFEGLSAAYQIQASAGTANPTWTNPNVGVNYSGFMVVFH